MAGAWRCVGVAPVDDSIYIIARIATCLREDDVFIAVFVQICDIATVGAFGGQGGGIGGRKTTF